MMSKILAYNVMFCLLQLIRTEVLFNSSLQEVENNSLILILLSIIVRVKPSVLQPAKKNHMINSSNISVRNGGSKAHKRKYKSNTRELHESNTSKCG